MTSKQTSAACRITKQSLTDILDVFDSVKVIMVILRRIRNGEFWFARRKTNLHLRCKLTLRHTKSKKHFFYLLLNTIKTENDNVFSLEHSLVTQGPLHCFRIRDDSCLRFCMHDTHQRIHITYTYIDKQNISNKETPNYMHVQTAGCCVHSVYHFIFSKSL